MALADSVELPVPVVVLVGVTVVVPLGVAVGVRDCERVRGAVDMDGCAASSTRIKMARIWNGKMRGGELKRCVV